MMKKLQIKFECPISSYNHFSKSIQEEDIDVKPITFVEISKLQKKQRKN